MKKYVTPEVELLALAAQDVIMVSDEGELDDVDNINTADLVIRDI